MLHHVTLEVDPADLPETIRFFELIGFTEVEAPAALEGRYRWLEHGGRQIHLEPRPQPAIPDSGHIALVAPDFEATVERLRAAGDTVEDARELWGEARAFAISPAGHRVELMAAPPAPSV